MSRTEANRPLPPDPAYYRRFVRQWVGADETFPIIVKAGKHGPTRGFVEEPGGKLRWTGRDFRRVAGKKPAVFVGADWLAKQAIPREAMKP